MKDKQNSLIILKSTLSRLPSYYCIIEERQALGEEYISATTIAESLSINPVQVRKDIASICSEPGRPKLGFKIGTLLNDLKMYLGYDHYDEAVQVYSQLMMKFPKTPEADVAIYLQANARMWLCRRLSYNIPRCLDTKKYLKMMIAEHPRHDRVDEMKEWLGELERYLEADAYQRAKFYDTKQRTPHATVAAWERFLADYPLSPHADEIRARIETLKKGVQK